MLYTFYNKNIPVFILDYDEGFGFSSPQKLLNPEFAPYGLHIPGYHKSYFFFKDWWQNRLIPTSRKNFDELNLCINSESLTSLTIKNFGLSLSDQYWFCPTEMTDISWKDLNYFQNSFRSTLDLNSLTLENEKIFSPDLSTNGNLPKKWIIIDDVRYLCKGTSEPFHQEAINEVAASQILDILEIPHIDYFCKDNLSFCPCFIDENTEFVPAWHIIAADKKLNHENNYKFSCRLFDKLDIPYKKCLDQMILFDFLISNSDRHYNNFGFIRDVNTLQFIQFAPLFDNGCSMWYNTIDEEIGTMVESKPFNTDFFKQIGRIVDKSVLDLSFDVADKIKDIFSEYNFSIKRIEKISKSIDSRQKYLTKLSG